MPRPTGISTVGDLRRAIADGAVPRRDVHQEVRDNLIRKLHSGEPLFPGIVGYDETVVPQLVNALLSQHNFILLGLRGQAKTRLLRALVTLLDDEIPVMPGCEINDDPLDPICGACRARLAAEGDKTPIAWLGRDARYVEKLATPDVTIADMVGDIDPIKAARSGLQLSSELTMHYGLLTSVPGRKCPRLSRRSSRRLRSRHDRIGGSTNARASASGCRSPRWKTSSRMPSGAR